MRHLIWDMGGPLIDTYPQVISALSSALENLDRTCPIPHEISGLVCAPDGFPRKPDPAMFLHALRAFHLAPALTAAVGDRPIDAVAAQAAGLRAFQIPAHGPGFTAVAAWVSGSADRECEG